MHIASMERKGRDTAVNPSYRVWGPQLEIFVVVGGLDDIKCFFG